MYYFSGNTGSGKSTLLNYIAGKKMKIEKINNKKHVVCEDPLAVIGITKNSETFLPSVYELGELVICDLPGLLDTRHPIIRIVNIMNILNIMKASESMSVIIVVDCKSTEIDKGSSFKGIQKFVEDFFGGKEKMEENEKSLKVVITKFAPGNDFDTFSEYLQNLCS